MAHQGAPKMSLVAQFDDLCRYTNSLLAAGCEEQFKIFVESQLINHRKYKESEVEIRKLNNKISHLKCENEKLETQNKHLKMLCNDEIEKRKQVETEKQAALRQIALVKELLSEDNCDLDNQTKEKLGFLESVFKQSVNSNFRLETVNEEHTFWSSMDATEDDLDCEKLSMTHSRRSPGKRSSSETRLSLKKKKFNEVDEFEDNEPEITRTPYRTHETRSNSEPATNSVDVGTHIHHGHKSDSDRFKYNSYNLRRCDTGKNSGGTPHGRYSTGGKLSRSHSFQQKTVIRTEKCYPCGKVIKFCKQALKCQDCRVVCHPECKEQCPIPCIPSINTPTKCGNSHTIADYTSPTSPMIPALIVHCVTEIEKRGFNEAGLYRVSGSDREVKELKEKYENGRNIPSLHQHDVHALCSLIKEFLRSLREPLITRQAWQSFVEAANLKDSVARLNIMYEQVENLPQSNRDTLAFLILHFQKVTESPACKMPAANLAKVLGPTIVGYSLPNINEISMLNETTHQVKVMECLLSIPAESWKIFLNLDNDVFLGNVKTPECLPVPQSTRLGPLYPPGPKSNTMTFGKTTPRTRNFKYNKQGKFSSPMMK